jgi:hypothetical protein
MTSENPAVSSNRRGASQHLRQIKTLLQHQHADATARDGAHNRTRL